MEEGLAGASAGGFEQRDVAPGSRVTRGRFEGLASGAPEVVADAFLDRWREELGVDPAQLGAPTVTELDAMSQVVRYPVEVDGVPVVGALVQVALAGGAVAGVHSLLPTQRPPSTTPTVSMETAAETAIGAVEGGVAGPARLVVLDRALAGGGDAHLAWEVVVESPGAPAEGRTVYVDALDGEVLATPPRARAARDRRVFHCNNTTDLAAATPVYQEAGLVDGATADPDAEEAFLNALLAHDYWEATFGRDTGRIEAYVHYGPDTLDNAYALSDGRLVFSDGNSDEDTFAHEFAHRIIDELTSNRGPHLPGLATEGEPGAVHEALADVFAMLALRREDWTFGNNGEADGEVLRDLENPSSPRAYGGLAPGLGREHHNSTILSHALFVATRTGSSGHPGLGEAKMEQVLYRALGYIGGLMGLRSSAEAIVSACMGYGFWNAVLGLNTHDVTVADCGVLRNALADAGLTEPDTNLDGWPDIHDNCPRDENPEQSDMDRDGAGDLCDLADGRFLVDLIAWNRTHWDREMISVHLLIGDETASPATWMEPMDFRVVTRAVAPGELVRFRAEDADGNLLADANCEVRDFHARYRDPGRMELLRVFFTTDVPSGRGNMFCEIDWIAPRSSP